MSDKPKCYAILPAAGRSRRMGQPKLLLPWPAEDAPQAWLCSEVSKVSTLTLIDRVLYSWTSSRVDEVVVIVRNDDQDLLEACARWQVSPVQPNIAPRDMKESVQHGLRYLQKHQPSSQDRFFVAPADMPTITSEIINRLVDTDSNSDSIVVPSYAGRSGHPVLLPWGLSQNIYALEENEGVDQVVSQHPQIMVEFEADERLRDVDTPDEYQAAFQFAQRRPKNQR